LDRCWLADLVEIIFNVFKVIQLAIRLSFLTWRVESIHFKTTFLDSLSPHTYCGKGFVATCLASGIQHYSSMYNIYYQIMFKS
jgi:hypothetical protein